MLRVEIIVNNIEELRCGKGLEKLPGMLAKLEAMVVGARLVREELSADR